MSLYATKLARNVRRCNERRQGTCDLRDNIANTNAATMSIIIPALSTTDHSAAIRQISFQTTRRFQGLFARAKLPRSKLRNARSVRRASEKRRRLSAQLATNHAGYRYATGQFQPAIMSATSPVLAAFASAAAVPEGQFASAGESVHGRTCNVNDEKFVKISRIKVQVGHWRAEMALFTGPNLP